MVKLDFQFYILIANCVSCLSCNSLQRWMFEPLCIGVKLVEGLVKHSWLFLCLEFYQFLIAFMRDSYLYCFFCLTNVSHIRQVFCFILIGCGHAKLENIQTSAFLLCRFDLCFLFDCELNLTRVFNLLPTLNSARQLDLAQQHNLLWHQMQQGE